MGYISVMEYVAFADEHNPGDWCVEARDREGNFHLTFFIGPDARERAEEYAAWRTDKESPRHAASV